jgi:Flp pilus assembly protein TadG
MKKKLFQETGQALILIALAAVGLFGVVGLAIDGSAKFSDRRHAQNAADTAALAGSLELARDEAPSPDTWDTVARDVAAANGYSGDLVSSQVWVHYCDAISVSSPVDCGPYNGRHTYIQVVVFSTVDTYFARLIGINQTHNLVNAVTYVSKQEPLAGGDSIVALNPNPSCPGSFLVGGSGTISLSGGGMFINSDNADCVWEQQGCNVTVNVTGTNWEGDPASISSAGGSIDVDPNCSGNINATTSTTGSELEFPPEMPEEPAECIAPPGHWTNDASYKEYNAEGVLYTGLTVLEPGRYNEFPPKSGGGNTVYDHVFLLPGIYCVNDSIKTVDKKLWLEGDNVTIYIRPGYKFSYEGGTINLSATESGPYADYVMIVATDFTGAPEACKIDGNAANSFTGTILAPYCNVTINGGSTDTSYNAQIIAYEVKLNGNNTINFTYDPDVNRWKEPKVGLMH